MLLPGVGVSSQDEAVFLRQICVVVTKVEVENLACERDTRVTSALTSEEEHEMMGTSLVLENITEFGFVLPKSQFLGLYSLLRCALMGSTGRTLREPHYQG
jgi:hypothetical protein